MSSSASINKKICCLFGFLFYPWEWFFGFFSTFFVFDMGRLRILATFKMELFVTKATTGSYYYCYRKLHLICGSQSATENRTLPRKESNSAFWMNWEIKRNWRSECTLSPSIGSVEDLEAKPLKKLQHLA